MRKPKETDFFIELPDVGTFRYGRQTIADRARIRADYIKIAGDSNEDYTLYLLASFVSAHKHSCVSAPAGWEDAENIDDTNWNADKVKELLGLLEDNIDMFRKGDGTGVKAHGQGISQDL